MALGHCHERIGESPLSYKYFGTSVSKIFCFVSEKWLFEVGIAVRPNSTHDDMMMSALLCPLPISSDSIRKM